MATEQESAEEPAEEDRRIAGAEHDHSFAPVPVVEQRSADKEINRRRLVVALVVAVVITLAAFVAAFGHYFARVLETTQPSEVDIGPFTVLVSTDVPPTDLILIAILALVGVAAAAVTFELIAALLTISPRRVQLERYRDEDLGPVPFEDVRVTVLVPAHNEELSLPVALNALADQTRQPDRVIVVADNCTDRTVEIASEMGYEAMESVDNSQRKAGALNQALARLLPRAGARDVFMIMDADTSLDPRFLETAAERLTDDPELTAVGGIFYGEGGSGLLGQFQRNEFTRYSLQLRARHGRVFVLTGTSSIFRAESLLNVAAARGVFIPGETGKVYDTAALTEDNELTLALKSLGATMASPKECLVTTEIMPTWKNLWVQRKRWQRGALENLGAYGMTAATIRYWGQQVGIAYGTIALNLALLLMLITILSLDTWIWFPFWLILGAVFLVERVLTVWRGGWRARLLAATLFPELFYDLFQQAVFVKCLIDIGKAKSTNWGHVEHPDRGASA